MVAVRSAQAEDADSCVAVTAGSPEHFTEDTHAVVRGAVATQQGWVAEHGDGVVGFVLAESRHPGTAELTWAAVLPERRGAGVGTALVEQALADLRAAGVALVEVKTLDASAGYEPYVAARAFWERRGFRQVDRIDPFPGWQPGNPAAIYVAALASTVPVADDSPTAPSSERA